jgi:tetratricopeptide (TPR) repeat protein
VVRLGVAASAVWLLAVGTLTLRQIPVWRDPETLWRYTVEVDPSCGRCRFGLGLVLAAQKGLLEPAIEQFEKGFMARPDLEGIGLNLSLALAKLHRFPEARQHLERLAAEHPDNATIRARLGAVLVEVGEPERAIEELEVALRLDPDRVEALGSMGIALAKLGRPADALPHLARAVALSPDTPGLQVWLARARHALREDLPGPQSRQALTTARPASPPTR